MKWLKKFKPHEIVLWSISCVLILASYLIFDRSAPLALCASLLGSTAIIFCAKGIFMGQIFMIIFSILYGIISYKTAYYGEMITYLGMTLPMSVASLISWLTHPYEGDETQVRISRLKPRDYIITLFLTVIVTIIFYFVLKHLGTASILISTISIATSFSAAYLTYRRSPYFSLCYAANDVVLIALWISAAVHDIKLVSVVVCFVTFLANDVYSYICWQKGLKEQQKEHVCVTAEQ